MPAILDLFRNCLTSVWFISMLRVSYKIIKINLFLYAINVENESTVIRSLQQSASCSSGTEWWVLKEWIVNLDTLLSQMTNPKAPKPNTITETNGSHSSDISSNLNEVGRKTVNWPNLSTTFSFISILNIIFWRNIYI